MGKVQRYVKIDECQVDVDLHWVALAIDYWKLITGKKDRFEVF